MNEYDANIENLKNCAKESKSFREVAEKLGKFSATKWTRLALLHGVETSHFCTGERRKTVEETLEYLKPILANQKRTGSNDLKHKLFYVKLKERKCEKCNGTEWMGAAIPLELHHVDGDRYNNNISNLQVLCSNCHAQTELFKGRNSKKARVSQEVLDKLAACLNDSFSINEALQKIDELKSPRGGYFHSKRLLASGQAVLKIRPAPVAKPAKAPVEKKHLDTPSLTEGGIDAIEKSAEKPVAPPKAIDKITDSVERLKQRVWESTITALAEEYGICQLTLSKFCKENGIVLPPRGYHPKRRAGLSHEEAMKKFPKRQYAKRITREQTLQAVRMIEEGHSMREAADAIGTHHSSIRYSCERFGIPFSLPRKVK